MREVKEERRRVRGKGGERVRMNEGVDEKRKGKEKKM